MLLKMKMINFTNYTADATIILLSYPEQVFFPFINALEILTYNYSQ